jgi:hypothetical protein
MNLIRFDFTAKRYIEWNKKDCIPSFKISAIGMILDCTELLADAVELVSSGWAVVEEEFDLSFKVNYSSYLLLKKWLTNYFLNEQFWSCSQGHYEGPT